MDSCRKQSNNDIDNSSKGGGSNIEHYHHDELYNGKLDSMELSLFEIKVENQKSRFEN